MIVVTVTSLVSTVMLEMRDRASNAVRKVI